MARAAATRSLMAVNVAPIDVRSQRFEVVFRQLHKEPLIAAQPAFRTSLLGPFLLQLSRTHAHGLTAHGPWLGIAIAARSTARISIRDRVISRAAMASGISAAEILSGFLQRGKFRAAPATRIRLVVTQTPPNLSAPSSSALRLSDQLAATPTWLSAQVPPCERAL